MTGAGKQWQGTEKQDQVRPSAKGPKNKPKLPLTDYRTIVEADVTLHLDPRRLQISFPAVPSHTSAAAPNLVLDM